MNAWRRISVLLLATVLSGSVLSGCGSTPDSNLIHADLARLADSGIPDEQKNLLVQGNNQFSMDLYHQFVETDPGNNVFSPYSISIAFSMVYAGARGITEIEMGNTFHYLSQDLQHSVFNALDQMLLEQGAVSESFELSIANSIWGQKDFSFEPYYLQVMAQYYGAGLHPVDFVNEPEDAGRMISGWIASETKDKFKDIVIPVNSDMRLVLVNAVYFKGIWQYPFFEQDTKDQPFTRIDDSQVLVAQMEGFHIRVPHFSGEGFEAVILPYQDSSFEMLILVPDHGRFHEIEQGLQPELINDILENANTFDVNLTMPKFSIDWDVDLKYVLEEMGLELFTPDANFSGIGRDLYISGASHLATITVDEGGTEASAVTIITMAVESIPEVELTIDRPFIFAIIDRETGTILFLGRVMDPSQ